MSLLDTLADAQREITRIYPEEVSVVDVPANKHPFVIIKSADGESSTDEKPEPTTAAILKDLETAFGSRFESLEKAIEDLKAGSTDESGDDSSAEDTPPAADTPVDVASVAAEVIKALQASGVIEAPKTPADAVTAGLTDLKDSVKKSFEQVGELLTGLTDRVAAVEGSDPGSGQEKETETKDDEADLEVEKSEGGNILSSMIMSGLDPQARQTAEA